MENKTKTFITKAVTMVVAATMMISALPMMPVKAAENTFDIQAVKKAPTIDGKVNADEWGAPVITVKKDEANIFVYEDKGTFTDFVAEVYVGYDKQNIYVAAVADYAEHKNETLKPGDLWMGDCMQIQISDTLGRNRNEINLSLNSINGNSMLDKPYGVGENKFEADKDYKVTREGTKTTYEIKISVENFSARLDELESGLQIPFSVAFHQSGGAFIEYCDGIVRKKDIALAAVTTLTGEPIGEGASDSKNDTAVDKSDVESNSEDSKDEGGISPLVVIVPAVIVIVGAIAIVLVVMKKKETE